MKNRIKHAPGAGAPPIPERSVPLTPENIGAAEEAVQATALQAGAPGDTALEARSHILHGNVARGVLRVALPSVATMLLQTSNAFLDRFFVGRLGVEAGAAITTGSSLMFALMSAAVAVSVGTTALVARAFGDDRIGDAERATQQSIVLSVVLATCLGLPMFFLRQPILHVLGLHAASLPLADAYLRVTILGLPTLFLMLILNGAFRGMGDTVRPFWVTLGANLVHATFNYLLIFGNLGFPRMGLPGGALALVLSQTMACGLYAFFLSRSPLRGLPRTLRLERVWTLRIARIGLPAAFQQFIRVGSMLAFQSLLAKTGAGDAAIAALGFGLVPESIAYMPGFGFSVAASAFVGQNLGARQPDRANAGAWSATWQAVAVMSAMGAIFWTFARPFAGIFVQHHPHETAAQSALVEETLRLTISYLKVAAWCEPFLALAMVLTGALQGAGETLGPTAITIGCMIFLRLPLAYVLSHVLPFGPVGAWWGMTISTVVTGLLTVFLFRRGHWRTVSV